MSVRKSAAGITMIGLFAANVAFALPSFSKDAPQSSIDTCLAEVRAVADFAEAGSVEHNIETEERRVSGHNMRIETLIFDDSGAAIIREYAATCAIDDRDKIRSFRIRQKAL